MQKDFWPTSLFYWLSKSLNNGFEAPQGGVAIIVQVVGSFIQDQKVFGKKNFWKQS